MNASELIEQVQENASEYLEMSNDPSTMVAGILALQVLKLREHIEYLERRLEYVSSTK